MGSIQVKRSSHDSASPQSSQTSRVEYGGHGGHNTSAAEHVEFSPFSFEATMEATELEDLLDQLYELSDKLSVFPGSKLLSEYRAVLHELLKRAAKGLRIKRDMRWRKTDRKLYITIEKTEKAMEELEEAFLFEGNRTKALAIMEEIKGCLISLLM